ncbi:hypothetical protein [Methylotenera sp.]|uniref:hypothetical protein n=1 Tax=Methylotenera sp. TaxID=2051956 RepID=UPI002487A396|nr:hypothetical protein [Methylotenera sp.]MDI1361018.1 hypothetical protein [Methylotenera sp.]
MPTNSFENLPSSSGSTESERYLTILAKKAFLTLWSYPNVYTDEGRKENGDGKELCDLLVVFGNDIILFSDKVCKFTSHKDINVAWGRWYRHAIEKSAKQLSGAESWIKRFPEKIFLDKKCQVQFPIKLPEIPERRIHLVAVTKGSYEPAERHWGGGSSGSLFIKTALVGKEHYDSPFQIGWPLPNKRLVHIFDELTLNVVLNELDTISDFVSYLTKKEDQFTTPNMDFLIPGEEELIALYLRHFDFKSEEHYLPKPPEAGLVVLKEGDWKQLQKSKEYRARWEENKISYLWDTLIEFQIDHILSGSASGIWGESTAAMNERIMRMMAEETRLFRRALGESIHRVNSINQPNKRFTRTLLSASREGRAYIFMTVPRPKEMSQEEYLEWRRGDLMLHAHGCKLKFEKVTEVIGISFAPGQEIMNSIDYFLITFGQEPFAPEVAEEIKQHLSVAVMWRPSTTKMKALRPIPFPHKITVLESISFWFKSKIFWLRKMLLNIP